jgi:hypothetical protein
MPNALYYGDNLPILRDQKHFPDECVDLLSCWIARKYPEEQCF